MKINALNRVLAKVKIGIYHYATSTHPVPTCSRRVVYNLHRVKMDKTVSPTYLMITFIYDLIFMHQGIPFMTR